MKTLNFSKSTARSTVQKMRPLYPGWALVHFLLAGFGLRLAVYHIGPFLQTIGLSSYEAFIVSFTVPMAVLFALAFRAVQKEGVPLNAHAIATRFHLKRPSWQDGLWLLVAFIVAVVGGLILAPTRSWILDLWPALQPPASFPALIDPTLQNQDLPATLTAWMGPNAAGNWSLVILAFTMFFFNNVGEELYWRGVLFPRQKLVHGRRTWLAHGLMWNLFHLPLYPWYLLFGLPVTLTISYLAQKTGNTWMTILLHMLLNLVTLGLIIMVVAGGI